jgi:TonB family protein
MSLSSIAVEQREKEAKALRYFLIYSLIASLALHIGLLAFVVNNLLSRVPKLENEPIEVVTIAPTVEATKPPEEKKSQPKVNSGGNGDGGGAGGGGKPAQPQTAASDKTPSFVPIARQPTAETAPHFPRLEKPEQLTPLPIPKFVDPVKKAPQERSQPTEPLKPVKKITPEIAQPDAPPVQETFIAKQPTQQTLTTTQKVIDTLKKAPRERSLQNITKEVAQPSTPPLSSAPPASITDNPDATQQSQTSNQPSESETNSPGNGDGNLGNRDGNGIGNGSGNGIGNGNGNGIGNGNGNGIGNKPKEGLTVATAPKPRTLNGSRLDRADCLKCNIKYPDSARSRGIEGNPEVAINYDQNGEVTNVQLIRPSGSRELDEALLEQARDFKLKPSVSGKQGVRVSANFVIRGTQRHRELQKRQTQQPSQSLPSDTPSGDSNDNSTKSN